MRGRVTEEIENLANRLLGIEKITVRQLRLMPYIQYALMNGEGINQQRINDEEAKILTDWRMKGFIGGTMDRSKITVSKKFWDAMSQILWLGYVNHES